MAQKGIPWGVPLASLCDKLWGPLGPLGPHKAWFNLIDASVIARNPGNPRIAEQLYEEICLNFFSSAYMKLASDYLQVPPVCDLVP